MTELGDIEARLQFAFSRFLDEYARWGAHRYYGWVDYSDPKSYYGPTFWTEGDCAFRFVRALEHEFPQGVHLKFPIARWTCADYDQSRDGRQFIDIAVSDLRDFVENHSSQERFRTHRHDLFIEVKYLPHGCSQPPWRYDHERKIPAILADANRLQAHLTPGHCSHAAVLVIDDDGLFEGAVENLDWPAEVDRLTASRRVLAERGIAAATDPP